MFVWNSIRSFLTEPFAKPLSPINYFLLVGFTIVAVILWSRVLAHVTEGIE